MGLEEFKIQDNATSEEKFYLWLKEKSPRTQAIYRKYLGELTEFFDMGINEIVNFHREDNALSDGGALRRGFLNFVKYATTERIPQLSKFTANAYLKSLNMCLDVNKLPKIKISYSRAHPQAKQKISLAQVSEMIKNISDPRMRAAVMVLKDSGLRVSDVVKLTVEDFIAAQAHYDETGREYRVWSTGIVTQKNEVAARVHLGFDAVEALKEHLGDRTEGFIFLTKQHGIGRPLSTKGLIARITYYCKPLREKGFNVSAHSFRKLFLTNMLAQGIQEVMAKMYVGKKVDDTDSAYYQFEDELTSKYLEVYPKALALDKTEYEVEKLRKDQHKRDSEIEELKAQMAQLQKIFETALEDVSGTKIKLDFPIGKKRDQE